MNNFHLLSGFAVLAAGTFSTAAYFVFKAPKYRSDLYLHRNAA